MNKIKVIGFDPSFRNFGFAEAFVNTGNLEIEIEQIHLEQTKGLTQKELKKERIRKNSDDLRCAKQLHRVMYEICKGATFVIAEIPVGSQSARASWTLGAAVGIVSSCQLPIVEVSPLEVKLASVGTKTASKDEIIEWAHDKYPHLDWLTRKLKGEIKLVKKNEHMADAIASIHAGVGTPAFKQLIETLQ